MVGAVTIFACMDTIAKLLARHYPVPQIVWARYFFHMLVMLAIFMPRDGLALVRTKYLSFQLIRGAVLVTSSLVFFSALAHMPLPEASSLTFLSPLLIAVLAGPTLQERVHPATWIALATGFAGVLLIVQPGSGVFTWVALLPLASALMMAIYQLMTRRLAGRERTLTTLFYPAIVGSVLVPIMFPFAWTIPQTALDAVGFVVIGILGALGHLMLIRSLSHAPATTLAPFVYTQIVAVVVFGWAVFGHFPDTVSLAGMAIIALSGLALALRNHRAG